MLVRSRWASSVGDCRIYIEAQTGNEHAPDHAIVRARVRLRIKANLLSNHPAKLKSSRLENLRLELRNRVEGFELDVDPSLDDK